MSPGVISIREHSQGADGSFGALVSFGESAEYEVKVTDPADEPQEALLAWYFQEHLRYPFLDHDRRDTAVDAVDSYGTGLFKQVFAGAASVDYQICRRRSFDGYRLVVEGSAAFHRLHWEALRDPQDVQPLAVRMPLTRRVQRRPARFELPPARQTLNILVVTARPDGANDVGYRTISRPLLDSLRQARLPVTLDIVRPGTWEALRARLRERTDASGSGWYQVVHFDLHGGVGEFKELAAARDAGRLLFGLKPYDGTRAFLYFETAVDGKAFPVPAEEVAELLAEHRVPVAVLNACQSAMDTTTEASLAQQLADAGVPVAVGMAYSVTVTAASKSMPVLYGQLAGGAEPANAVRAARRALHDDRRRQAYFDQEIELQDWLLPVVFQQEQIALNPAAMTAEQKREFIEREALIGDEPATTYGFVGRDLDIQAIERRLLGPDAVNLLVVRGMAGTGKSTLLHHVGWWWRRTSLVDRVLRYSYEDRVWTPAQMVRDIAQQLLSPGEAADLDSYSPAAQAETVARELRARRHLIIIDNAESITATPASIPNALDEGDQERLRTFLMALRGGKTLVLLGSREAEEWLSADVYPLPGLDPQAASDLVQRIFKRHNIPVSSQDAALPDLIKLLGGSPLAMTVVLPELRNTTATKILDDLRSGDAGADPAGFIAKAIEYSHGKLDPDTQHNLLLLAPFTGAIPHGPLLQEYHDILVADETVAALGPIDPAGAVAEAIRVGLAGSHPADPNSVQVQPVLPYFLRTRLHGQAELQLRLGQAHHRFYSMLGNAATHLMRSYEAPERAAGTRLVIAHYANLTAALGHGLNHNLPVTNVLLALDGLLNRTGQHATRYGLTASAIEHRNSRTDTDAMELGLLHGLAGHAALEQRRFETAERHYRKSLDIELAHNDQPGAAITYHQLGRIAEQQRRYDEAERHYRKSLDIELAHNNQPGAAITYHQLGMIAQQQGRYDEAERHYRKSLDIKLAHNNQPGAATTYHQLGMIAQQQGRYDEAERHYRKSLDIELAHNDQPGAATTYHQLGIIAQLQRRYDEAERHYRKSLDIELAHNNQPGAATTYHQLGIIAEQQRRYDEAERHYRKSLDINLTHNNQPGAATSYGPLGMLLVKTGRLPEALEAFILSATIDYEIDGRWPDRVLMELKKLRSEVPELVEAAVRDHGSLLAAIDNYSEQRD